MPFREAHRRTGELLRALDERAGSLRDLSDEAWAAFGLDHGSALLDPDRSVAARSGPGGPAPASVKGQIDGLDAALAD